MVGDAELAVLALQLQERPWPPDDGWENVRVHNDAAGAWRRRRAGGCTACTSKGVRDTGGEGNISDGGEGGGGL